MLGIAEPELSTSMSDKGLNHRILDEELMNFLRLGRRIEELGCIF